MNNKPIFKNKPNNVYEINGKQVWESRSVAVNGIVLAQHKDNIYVLAEKRSSIMMDEPGKWCVCSGYLDFNETGYEAIIREIYEETSLYIPNYKIFSIYDNEEPFFVNTDPNQNRQNVSLNYGFIFKFNGIIWKDIENYKNEEIERIKWINLLDLNEYDWAFKHDERIKHFYDNIARFKI